MSSVFGLVAPPGQTAYAASKFAVRGFSEALRHELQGSPVAVTVVHPGGVATAIAQRARQPASLSAQEIARDQTAWQRMLRLPAEVAGETIVRGVERRQARVLVGSDAKAIALIARVAPVSYWKLMAILTLLRAV
jgi:short-subunit dehydrogenase